MLAGHHLPTSPVYATPVDNTFRTARAAININAEGGHGGETHTGTDAPHALVSSHVPLASVGGVATKRDASPALARATTTRHGVDAGTGGGAGDGN